ncbi:MAG: 2-hydroxychromene-2-carboxylate isomerase [Hyphomicrobiaceae bacterium]|nr:2-hydroxychromene-2-carboxylate isomerase [Hyphomicrobiaceae bacterium]
MPHLDFWYEFGSTYSYLSAMRIGALASESDVAVRWHPFLLGPILKKLGWETSPFKTQKGKCRHMVRDMERICAARGLSFAMPDTFPQNGLYAARIALIAADEGWAEPFTQAVYLAEYAEGRDIADKAVLAGCLQKVGRDEDAYFAKISEPEAKERLKTQTEQAMSLGIFGAPTFITQDSELFWGDDRLEQALAWTVK